MNIFYWGSGWYVNESLDLHWFIERSVPFLWFIKVSLYFSLDSKRYEEVAGIRTLQLITLESMLDRAVRSIFQYFYTFVVHRPSFDRLSVNNLLFRSFLQNHPVLLMKLGGMKYLQPHTFFFGTDIAFNYIRPWKIQREAEIDHGGPLLAQTTNVLH